MATAGNSISVLHVDDDPMFADLVATFIERDDEQISLQTLTRPTDALDRLLENGVDCIVSDYDMPGMNGIEFLEHVRVDHPKLPFILYTGKGSEAIAGDAISAGVTDYIQKESGTGQYTVLKNRIRNSVETYYVNQALEDRDKHLSLFFEQSPFGVIEWNTDFDIVRQNEAASEILGYQLEELAGESWKTIVPESDRNTILEVLADLLENRGGYHSINVNIRKDNTRIVCEWHNRVVTDEADNVVAIFSQFRDITDKIERNRELERYETYLQESNDIIAVLDPAGTITYVSPSITRILGHDPETMVGLNGFDLLHPDDRTESYDSFLDLVDASPEDVTDEARFQTTTGEWRWLEIRGANRLPGEDGTEIVFNLSDITARKAYEETLREERERFEQVLETVPVGITILNTDGSIERANARAEDVLGLVRTEIADRTYDDAAWSIVDEHGDAIPSEDLPFSRVMATGEKVFDYEHGIQWPDGKERWLSINAAPIHGSTGDIEHVVAVISDITDQRDDERTIKRKNQRLQKFASVLSHDLRNPLTVAQGRLQLAKSELDPEHLDDIELSLARMDELIDSLLTLARGRNGDFELEPVQLHAVVEQCWRTVETGSATLSIETDQAVLANRPRLQQLLENLFRNSIEHAGSDTHVTVGALTDGFYVEDDGPGIPVEERDTVFEVGYTTADTGIGVGLSIVQEIANTHHWTLTVTDGAAGGVRFEVTGVEPVGE